MNISILYVEHFQNISSHKENCRKREADSKQFIQVLLKTFKDREKNIPIVFCLTIYNYLSFKL